MIIDSLLEIIINFLVSVFDLLHIPDTPNILIGLKNTFISVIANYVMPIINFLFGHTYVQWAMNLLIVIFNIMISYKLIVWIYDKVRGGSSE